MIAHSVTEHARTLAAYLPNGKTFEGKNILGSNFHQLLRGLAGEMTVAEGYLLTLEKEYFPDETVLFLDEWERALGIPDDCFPGTGSIDERRIHILVKLTSLGVQTAQDFIDLAALFGITVSVEPASEHARFPYTFPILLLGVASAKYTILVTFTVTVANEFPLTFPFTFGDPIIAVLKCLYSKLKPANCELIFVEV